MPTSIFALFCCTAALFVGLKNILFKQVLSNALEENFGDLESNYTRN
jgi:hypothetical protein